MMLVCEESAQKKKKITKDLKVTILTVQKDCEGIHKTYCFSSHAFAVDTYRNRYLRNEFR